MNLKTVRPPYDPELRDVFGAVNSSMPAFATESLEELRRISAKDVSGILEEKNIQIENTVIHGYAGGRIGLSILRKKHSSKGPILYHSHGGGMVLGNRWSGITAFLDWVELYGAVIVTVEYRLAPEFPDPYPREDAYAGLVWTAENAQALGLEGRDMVIVGQSAGGGITAGLALMARDRMGPKIHGQILLSPMLDDSDSTDSTRQFEGTGGWDRDANIFGWNSLLGASRSTDSVCSYAAPARSENLAGLPPTFLECGTAEVFRDEVMDYASRLWQAGNETELHMWSGGFHRYDIIAPDSCISLSTVEARKTWLVRLCVNGPNNA